ncbi:MAG: hypothetical protein JJT85_09230 [Chromatiales bacterium]|nr:hypothetical protein [Chromatiales bacterium]
MTTLTADSRSAVRSWLLLAVTCALGLALALEMARQLPRQWPSAAQLDISIGDEHYRLDARHLAWLAGFTSAHFADGGTQARALVHAEIDRQLDPVFAAARAALPGWVDWYWSLGAEYMRIAAAGLAAAGVETGDLAAARLQSALFPDASLEQALSSLDVGLAAQLPGLFSELDQAWLEQVTSWLSDLRIPAPLQSGGQGSALTLPPGPLHAAVPDADGSRFAQRLGTSTLAGAGAAAGPTLLSMATARGAGRSARLARLGWLARSGKAAGTAATGSGSLCAPAGTLALGCALVAGTVTFVATDWVLLRLEASRERETMIAALEQALEDWEADLKAGLVRDWEALIAAHTSAATLPIREGFVPARALR